MHQLNSPKLYLLKPSFIGLTFNTISANHSPETTALPNSILDMPERDLILLGDNIKPVMKCLCILMFLWAIAGCKDRGITVGNASVSGPWTVLGWYTLPEMNEQEGDKIEIGGKSGKPTNSSVNERAFKQSEAYLQGFDEYVAARTDLELFAMIAPAERGYNNAEYRVASMGNDVIIQELYKRRGKRLLDLPREEDYKEAVVFTGDGGPYYSIRDIIQSLRSK